MLLPPTLGIRPNPRENPGRNQEPGLLGDAYRKLVVGYAEQDPPLRDTVVPLICGSDDTQLTNHSGDKKGYPRYLAIGNIHLSIRSRPTWQAQVIIALLPIPPKLQGIPKDKDSIRLSGMMLHDTLD
ncbi:hypothetical protein BDD12DRAFT_741370 [Trichophaea hybrida]|nr:hypothetical protein BDD12DRAFT_741370 [Trichophaea hybrida]